jgi:hypothetical protein
MFLAMIALNLSFTFPPTTETNFSPRKLEQGGRRKKKKKKKFRKRR